MSDLPTRIKDWARNMGYDGYIPKTLNKICSPSTALIWEQIISNINPKQEVAHVRRNIIVHRLKQKSLTQQHEFYYPVKEIDVFLKKQSLEKRENVLEKTIEEKEMLIECLLEKNKKTYVVIDNKKEKIKEISEKKFLIEQKCKFLEDDLHNAEEVLTLARNLTPVELEENANGNDITETLEKCAEKLYKLSQEIPLTINTSQINMNRYFSLTTTRMKTPRNLRKKIDFSKCISLEDKENFSFSSNVKRCPQKKLDDNESIGLLPDSYLDEFDEFFLSRSNESLRESFLVKTSLSNHNDSNLSQEKVNFEIFETLRDNQHVKDTLKNVLYNNNRQLIIKCCEKIYEFILNEIKKSAMEYSKMAKSLSFVDEDDLNDLYFIHIKNELEREKHQAIVRNLQENLRKRKEELYVIFSSTFEDMTNKHKQKFEQQVEDGFLMACNNFLHQKIESLKKLEVGDDLQTVTVKLGKIKDEIFLKFGRIRVFIENIHKILEQIKSNQEEASSYVRSISPYIFNLSMASLLKEELNFQEIQSFDDFPLEYNRKFLHNDFYRNLGQTTVPSYIDLDSKNLEMVTTLMDTPFSPSDSVIVNMLQSRIKLNILKSFQFSQPKVQDVHHTYTTEGLYQREKYVKDIISKLNFMINSSSVNEILSAPSVMQETVDLWKEMPFRDYISEKRLVDGQNYKYFEKLLDNLYNNF